MPHVFRNNGRTFLRDRSRSKGISFPMTAAIALAQLACVTALAQVSQHGDIGVSPLPKPTTLGGAEIIYVDINANGLENGTSWNDAFKDLTDGIAAADTGDELWVAMGTYRPTNAGGSRTISFSLVNDVAIYGGFAGSETMRDQRIPSIYLTTLSGDLDGDDGPGPFENNTENSFHVVNADGVSATAILDGFTITGGNANGVSPNQQGAGITMTNGQPTITDCYIGQNTSTGRGAGVFILNNSGTHSPTFRSCVITGNVGGATSGHGGGGIWSGSALGTLTTSLIRCSVTLNSATGHGGGIVVSRPIGGAGTSHFNLVNSYVYGNTTDADGGAIYIDVPSSNVITMTNCELDSNTALNAGGDGGGIYHVSGDLTVTNATITRCEANSNGGGINTSAGNFLVATNSILWGNEDSGPDDESAQLHITGGVPNVSYSIVQGGWSGAGTNNLSSNPMFIDPFNYDNRVHANSPAVDSGNNGAVPTDVFDVDNDSNTNERIPLGLGGLGRFADNPYVADTGNGIAPIVDRGAWEVRELVYLYVDEDGLPGIGDWAAAYSNLQDALIESQASAETQIWVAGGTYYPDLGAGITPGDRSATFQLRNHVEIYGGFAGNETDLSQRDVFANGVILSGDLNGDDGPNFANRSDNSYNVVTASGTDNTARLDGGIYVVGGNADGNGPTANEQRGGGCYNDGGDAYFFRVNFQDNQAQTLGGNVFQANDADVTYEFCQFKSGAADLGGGLAIDGAQASAFLYYSTIEDNTATTHGGGLYVNLGSAAADGALVLSNDALFGDGGGLYFIGTPPTTWSNCDIDGNYANFDGGGVRLASGSDITFDTCGFDANDAEVGGAVSSIGSDPTFTFCTFDSNTARFGGAIDWNQLGLITIQDSIFANNVASSFVSAAAGAIRGDGDGVIDNCDFVQNSTNGHGGAIQFKGSGLELRISNSLFEGNSATGSAGGGAIAVGSTSSVLVATSTFTSNQASGLTGGGAIANATGCTLQLMNSRFAGNMAFRGGAVNNDGTLDAVNCAFSGNLATNLRGGAVEQGSGDSDIVNCTVVGNSATLAVGGGLSTNGGVFNIRNSVLWNNEDNSGQTELAQFFNGGGSYDVDYTLIQQLSTWTTPMVYVGNIGSDPQFVDADGLDNLPGTVDDDFRIKPASPAIDAGSVPSVPMDSADIDEDSNTTESVPWGLDGAARFYNDPDTDNTGEPDKDYPMVDIGAFEFLGADCNSNNVPDNCDINCGPENGACDVPGCGNSSDADMDGVPDECGIFSGDCPMMSDNWSCFDNWSLPGDVYPDNTGGDSYDVILDNVDDVFLDVDVIIDSLLITDEAKLRMTQSGPDGDLTIATDLGLRLIGTGPMSTQLLTAGNRMINLTCGPVTVLNAFYGPSPTAPPGSVNSILNCETLRITQPSGEVQIEDSMSINASVDLIVDGRGATPCTSDGGKTTPIKRVFDNGSVNIGGNFTLDGNTNFNNASAVNMNVGGNFFNTGNTADCFDCSQGGISLIGTGTQTFEVSGEDLGASMNGFVHPVGHTNFSWEDIEISGGASHVVRFLSERYNGFGGDPCTEALYVRNLTLQAGATITIDEVKVYYLNLVNNGATINLVGCGQLLPVQVPCTTNLQCDDNAACTYDDCHMSFCRFTEVEYGNVNGIGPTSPNLDDILCVLAGFANMNNCTNGDIRGTAGTPCVPNNIISLDDILAVLGAFGGADLCGCVP